MQANLLKTAGYLVSTLSVLLLGGVAWITAEGDDALRLLVILGILSSVAGMFMRWLSYQEDRQTDQETGVAGRTTRA